MASVQAASAACKLTVHVRHQDSSVILAGGGQVSMPANVAIDKSVLEPDEKLHLVVRSLHSFSERIDEPLICGSKGMRTLTKRQAKAQDRHCHKTTPRHSRAAFNIAGLLNDTLWLLRLMGHCAIGASRARSSAGAASGTENYPT